MGATRGERPGRVCCDGFQFTRPGGRDGPLCAWPPQPNVSIHAPGWARHVLFLRLDCEVTVSIHAPGWARPSPGLPAGAPRKVSIHAPGWARPRPRPMWGAGIERFQFTRPGGRDRGALQPSQREAPGFNSRARVGATWRIQKHNDATTPFQFTRPGGRDSASFCARACASTFQFTRPGGRDPPPRPPPQPPRSFNSRARVGATGERPGRVCCDGFQFTRPGGRDTRPRSSPASAVAVSIHAPGWARLPAGAPRKEHDHVSIHAPGWARLDNNKHNPKGTGFNSRARVGATRRGRRRGAARRRFNSRARVGATGQ